jgi:hypothetical protein
MQDSGSQGDAKLVRLIQRARDRLVRQFAPPPLRRRVELWRWARSGFAAPSPSHVKLAVLRRLGIPDACWVETGTFKGETTRALARSGKRVFSIEADESLFASAKKRLMALPNVTVFHGRSELVLPDLLRSLDGNINFWLDGHYSGGSTFKGPTACPIQLELSAIHAARNRLGKLAIFIDDMRCFQPTLDNYRDYPSRGALVAWAEVNGYLWHIEHDIMCLVSVSAR